MSETKCMNCQNEAVKGLLCESCWKKVRPRERWKTDLPAPTEFARRNAAKKPGKQTAYEANQKKALREAKEDERYALSHVDHGDDGKEGDAGSKPTGQPGEAGVGRAMPKDKYRVVATIEHVDRNISEPGPYLRFNEEGRIRAFQAVPATRRRNSGSDSSTEQFQRLLRKELEGQERVSKGTARARILLEITEAVKGLAKK